MEMDKSSLFSLSEEDIFTKKSENIKESIISNSISDEEFEFLCSKSISFIKKAETIPKASIELINELIVKSNENNYIFELIESLKAPLSTKTNIETFISLIHCIINKITPAAFWSYLTSFLNETRPVLTTNVFNILKELLINDTTFKVGSSIKDIINNQRNFNSSIKNAAFDVLSILFSRKPKLVEKLINEQTPSHSKFVLEKLKNANKIAENSLPENLFEDIKDDFAGYLAKITPCNESLNTRVLFVEVDNDEMKIASIRRIVSACKGSNDKKETINVLRNVITSFVELSTDKNENVVKEFCMAMSSIGEMFASEADKISCFVIPALVNQTNHENKIIAQSSRLALINFVSHVSGDLTKTAVIESYQNQSIETKCVLLEAMIDSLNKWPMQDENFCEIIKEAQNSKSEKIRNSVSSFSSVPKSNDSNDISKISYLIDNGKGEELANELDKIEVFGDMKSIIEFACNELNGSNPDTALRILDIITLRYSKYLFSFITTIIENLPENDNYGKNVIKILIRSFGEKPIIYLLQSSNVPYAHEFVLKNAQNDSNIDVLILNAIKKHAFDYNSDLIINIIKKIYKENSNKVEALFISIPIELRKEILPKIETELPHIYKMFNSDDSSLLLKLLMKEKMKAKMGKDINQNIIQKSLMDEKTANMAIDVLLESPITEDTVLVLMIATESEYPSVANYAGKALKRICKEHPEVITIIPDCLSTTYGGFRSFIGLIKSSSKEQVSLAMKSVRDQFMIALEIEDVRNAVLDVLAAAIAAYGDEFEDFLGDLDEANQITLNVLLEKRMNKKKL